MVLPFNNTLFSSYHLEKVVEDQTSDTLKSVYDQIKQLYASVTGFVENLNEPQTEEQFIRPVLKCLGHVFEVQPILPTSLGAKQPDYAFFADQESLDTAHPQVNTDTFFNTAVAVGDAKAWKKDLDKKTVGGRDPFSNANPNYQIDFYIRTSGLRWGMLTNGKLWRLYHRDTSYKLDSFYEVNLEKILTDGDIEAFRYFYYFFRSEALVPDPSHRSFLDDVLSGSIHYTVSVSDDLGEKIYLALEELINGFLSYQGNNLTTSAADVEKIHENSLILLYRLLFVLYAESRGLLPLQNPEYQTGYSVKALAVAIYSELDTGAAVPDLRTDYWDRLQTLFNLIDKGWEEDIPQYNGGLFNSTRHQFLVEKKIGNRSLAKVIDTLTRTTEQERIAYQDLAIQHLGNIYEGLLEYKPTVQHQIGSVKLKKNKNAKKASGSYYTSDAIVRSIHEKIEFLQQPKVISQNIIAHITDPKSHIKIMATADQTGKILSVDTVTNTVLTDRNTSPIFISALLNSTLINWYAHRFIFASAVRTMNFDEDYVGKIPVPIVTPEEQQPIIELAEQIIEAKQKDPEVDTSAKEQKIDTLVYNLYGLETEERKIVQSSFEKNVEV